MNILVTGGSGFIGSHIVDKLIEAKHQVRVLDLKVPYRNDVDFIQGNVISRQDVSKALKDIEIVYHIAAFSNIDWVKDNPVQTIEFNILGTTYLLEESAKRGVKRFLFASSVYVNSGKGHLYTTAKLASEMLCRNYYTLYSLPYTILRYGTAYGPRSRQVDVISIFVAKALKDEGIVIHGDGSQKRNFIFVEDMAEASIAAMKDIGENKTYIIAGIKTVSIKKLAELVRKAVNSRLNICIDNTRQRENDYQGKIGGLEETMVELNWRPKTTLSEGVRKYKDWYLDENQ